jgi:protein O-GlcNAc transferase
MANQSSTPFDQGLFLVHRNRGREHFDKRSFGDAAAELEEARRLRPEDDSVLNLLGLAYFKQEKYKQADAVYRKLIDLNPESYTLHFNLGLVCFKTADLDNAEAIFLRALELKPDNQKTHFYLGNIYEKKKLFNTAIFKTRNAGATIMFTGLQ